MNSVICTLFEGNYHYGVAALVNSLYLQGYRGVVYAGYKGGLPSWSSTSSKTASLQWPEGSVLEVADGIQIYFLPLDTTYHLTNYKPDFMLLLWNSLAKEADNIFYFDPDIVLTAPWTYFEEWIRCGIAVCEDIKSPLEKYHPRRMGWRKYYEVYGINLKFKNNIYVNGGFIGIKKSDIAFIETWQLLQQRMAKHIGGLNRSSITSHTKLPQEISVDFSPFGLTDQDALNATIEACEFNISYMRQEAMGLNSGTPVLMPHALGSPKPWKYNPILMFITGRPPRFVDKQYWTFVEYPIRLYSREKVLKMNFIMKSLSFLSRFYRR
jgi:hypothetical protein